MTIGAERPPYGARQARFSPLGDHLTGRFFSVEMPSRFGPRHSAQSLKAKMEKARQRFKEMEIRLVILEARHLLMDKNVFRVRKKSWSGLEVSARWQPKRCILRKLTLLRYKFFAILSGSGWYCSLQKVSSSCNPVKTDYPYTLVQLLRRNHVGATEGHPLFAAGSAVPTNSDQSQTGTQRSALRSGAQGRRGCGHRPVRQGRRCQCEVSLRHHCTLQGSRAR